jgi:hypothetical protein
VDVLLSLVYDLTALRIRLEQIEAFNAVAAKRFEDVALSHVSEFAPKLTAVLGADRTRAVVRLGIQRASTYGFRASGPVHLFLDLMFLLGAEFDTDPQYPWAAAILNDPSIPGEMSRADTLHARAAELLDAVTGPDNRLALEALRRLHALAYGGPAAAGALADGGIVQALESVHPQKATYLGQTAMHALMVRSSARAAVRQLSTPAAALLFACLEFSLGHAFERDPLYPWVGATLEDEKLTKPDPMIARLYRKAATYLDHVVAYLDQEGDGKIQNQAS